MRFGIDGRHDFIAFERDDPVLDSLMGVQTDAIAAKLADSHPPSYSIGCLFRIFGIGPGRGREMQRLGRFDLVRALEHGPMWRFTDRINTILDLREACGEDEEIVVHPRTIELRPRPTEA